MLLIETGIDDILICIQNNEDDDHQLIRCLEKAQKIGMTVLINVNSKQHN